MSACTRKVQALTSTACTINYTAPQHIHLHLQGKFLHLPCWLFSIFCITHSRFKLILPISDGGSQVEHILLMLKDGGSIPQDTLQSQDGINLGDIHFYPLLCTLHMQHLSLNGLHTLLAKGVFMPCNLRGPPN